MSQTATEKTPALDVVAFMLGNQRFAIEATQVRTLLPQQSDISAQPLEHLIRLPKVTIPQTAQYNLLLKHPAGDYAVTVSAPVTLLSLDSSAIQPLPPLIAACSNIPSMRALAIIQDELIMLLDINTIHKADY